MQLCTSLCETGQLKKVPHLHINCTRLVITLLLRNGNEDARVWFFRCSGVCKLEISLGCECVDTDAHTHRYIFFGTISGVVAIDIPRGVTLFFLHSNAHMN